MKYYHILLIIFGGIAFFFALWIFITFAISRTGGWHRLSKTYATSYIPAEDKIIRSQFGKLGVARYKFTLNIRQSPLE